MSPILLPPPPNPHFPFPLFNSIKLTDKENLNHLGGLMHWACQLPTPQTGEFPQAELEVGEGCIGQAWGGDFRSANLVGEFFFTPSGGKWL